MKNTYSLDKHSVSSFFKGELIETKNFESSLHIRGSERWSAWLELERIEKGVSVIPGSATKEEIFNRTGIAYEFSKLKTDKDINQFAQKYGLLGIVAPKFRRIQEDIHLKQIFRESLYFALPYGYSYFEPLEIWKFYIDQIRKILKLYKTLVNIHNGTETNQVEGNLLNIGGEFIDAEDHPMYFVEWWDGTHTGTGISPEIAEKGDFLKIGRQVLIGSVNYQANRSLTGITVDIIETDKPPLGFYVQESKITQHLINVIYYDLWDLISKNEPVYICKNPNCKLPFKKVKRQQYCTNACKQEAYRIRKYPEKYMLIEKRL